MEIKGKIHEIGSTQQVSETFKKRSVIVEYAENPTYPEYVNLELQQDKTSLLDMFRVGDEVDVFFNLKGRPWTDRTGKTSYFNTLVIWRINKLGESSSAPTQQEYVSTPPDADDDLPF